MYSKFGSCTNSTAYGTLPDAFIAWKPTCWEDSRVTGTGSTVKTVITEDRNYNIEEVWITKSLDPLKVLFDLAPGEPEHDRTAVRADAGVGGAPQLFQDVAHLFER